MRPHGGARPWPSSRMNFKEPDAAPREILNRMLWHDAKGWNMPYPEVQRSLFFPLAIDVDDEEREVKAERTTKKRD